MSIAPPIRRVADLWPMAAFAACVAALLLPLSIGRSEARLAAALQLAGIAGGLLYGAVRGRTAARHEGGVQPSWSEALLAVVRAGGMVWVGLAALFGFVHLAGVAPGSGPRNTAQWINPAMAAVVGGLLALHMAWTVRLLWRNEGVERQVFMEATSVAFFVTLVAGAIYALFEYLAGAPRLSMWVVWTFGMFTWGAISWYRMRQVR